jgi:multidrug resistance efflux pump
VLLSACSNDSSSSKNGAARESVGDKEHQHADEASHADGAEQHSAHLHESEAEHAEHAGSEVTNRISIPEQVRRNLGITFAKVEMRRIASTLRMPGRFELQPTARREYSAPLAGRVELLVQQYDKVTTGVPLYRLDSADWRRLKQDIADAQAQMGVTSAALLLAQVAQSGGPSASQVYKQRVTAGARHVESLRQSLAASEARVQQVEQLQKLVGGKLSELAEARAKVAEARTALTQAEEENADVQREALRQSTEGGSVFGTTASLTASLEAKRAEYQAARIRLEVALASAASVLGRTVDEITSREGGSGWESVEHIEIRAASEGIVQSLAITNGSYVEAAKPVLTVADPSLVRFRAIALQGDLERLRDGMPAYVLPPGPSMGSGDEKDEHQPMQGILTFGQEADPDQRSLDVIITLRDKAHWARAGVASYVEAVTDENEDPTPAVPVAAVLQDDLDRIYFRRDPADPNKAIRVVADLGISDGQWLAVESGLKAGDEVVLGGAYQLKLAGGGKSTKAGHFHADGTFHEGKD